jgi:hydrogenase nickel incorporation protein HypA/HybF
MHEISISQHILRSLEAELPTDEYMSIKEIKLKIGALAGIEPVLLHNAFRAVTEGTTQENIDLAIDFLEVKAHCDLCNKDFKVKMHKYICDTCGKPSSNVVQGNEMLIHQVVF